MKIHALLVAMALAATGTAFAQSYGTSGSYSDSSATAKTTEAAPAKVHKNKVSAKAKKDHAQHHASATHHKNHHEMHTKAAHHQHHEMHARAHAEHHNTHAMGAGPSGPVTDLNARGRQDRINAAYEDWRRLQARR
ncbi:hypothetical protein GCM10028796_32860 [Ramlibacter monticola]|uniref:Uncharacterized protein n=1 Tax=Ramlibacter monticola TaxID=1926872 RepID=A0A937CWY1_9BURK|nr:hypothetical protein [Ramlibacter monticola]MBL0394142.1 hypothetical protein [Ramlibacter monticola]